MKKMKKKIISTAVFFLMTFSGFLYAETEILLGSNFVSEFPAGGKNIVIQSMKPSAGGNLNLEIRPFPFLGIFTDGFYSHYGQNGKDLKGFDYYGGEFGADYILKIPSIDFINLKAGVNLGLYSGTHYYSDDDADIFSGYLWGVHTGAEFRILPWLNTNLLVNYKQYENSIFPISTFSVTAGFSVNLKEAFVSSPKISARLKNLSPVFPVLYSWYNENPFGTVIIENSENTSITDVRVYFYCEQYMTKEKFCGEIKKIKSNSTGSVDLTAFFNESTLQLLENTNANAKIILEYKRLNKKIRTEIPVSLPVCHRNSMSWEDDRRAAVFVSPNDQESKSFAMQIASIVRHNLIEGKNVNYQYAAALFESLSLYGMNYVVDPSSAYADNVGSTSIDFLQFPYQTLNYRGGDCDDLSILYCSLLEALGIESAFITVPGHIYAAFDSGVSEKEARESLGENYILKDDKVWIPVEITMIKDGFNAAVRFGMSEWKKASGNGAIYPMHESWEVYKTVAAPGVDGEIYIPSTKDVILQFQKQIK